MSIYFESREAALNSLTEFGYRQIKNGKFISKTKEFVAMLHPHNSGGVYVSYWWTK